MQPSTDDTGARLRRLPCGVSTYKVATILTLIDLQTALSKAGTVCHCCYMLDSSRLLQAALVALLELVLVLVLVPEALQGWLLGKGQAA
jgi:hypothetical protein